MQTKATSTHGTSKISQANNRFSTYPRSCPLPQYRKTREQRENRLHPISEMQSPSASRLSCQYLKKGLHAMDAAQNQLLL